MAGIAVADRVAGGLEDEHLHAVRDHAVEARASIDAGLDGDRDLEVAGFCEAHEAHLDCLDHRDDRAAAFAQRHEHFAQAYRTCSGPFTSGGERFGVAAALRDAEPEVDLGEGGADVVVQFARDPLALGLNDTCLFRDATARQQRPGRTRLPDDR